MTAPRVLLIGWDAADWKVIHPLMDAGKMPHLRRFVENGVTGPVATLHPPLSPMLWTSIATGKRPFKHGIHGFAEPTPDGRDVRAVTNLSRKSKALWNILNQNDRRSVVVGWWPSHPAEPIDGVMVSDQYHRAGRPIEEGWPLPPHTVHPPKLAATLAGLRVHPDRLTAEMVEPFIPLAREIDQERDDRLGVCMRTLAECMSIHSAARWLMENQPWDFFAVYFDAIDHFSHGFMRYHPPRQAWIGERDFQLYQHVVSAAYEWHDRMLGELIEKSGADTRVVLVSDHGFHPDHLRPASIPDVPAGPAIEHRDFGILAIRGPGIKKDEGVHGASVLDVAPTILAMYGLPAGDDMDGKPLSQVFCEPPEVHCIPSWDAVPGRDGCHPPCARFDPVAAHTALEQMIALGYIDRPDEDRAVAVEMTVRELRYNVGESYQDAGRHREALEIFKDLRAADPDEQRFAVRLFVSCQALGMHAEMRRVAEDLDGRRRALFEEAQAKVEAFGIMAAERRRERMKAESEPAETLLSAEEQREVVRWRNLARFQPAVADYLQAQVWIVEKRYAEALAGLERIEAAHLVRPGIFPQTAELYMRLGRWGDAQRVYDRALEIDPDHAPAYLGLCRLALRERRFRAAADLALEALARTDQDAGAHYLLGRALVGIGQYERAAEAFGAAISANPHFAEAEVRLAALLDRRGEAAAAREHRELARRMRSQAGLPAVPAETAAAVGGAPVTASDGRAEMPTLGECLVVVTGLPRSGTSLLMQMLAAGGMQILSDETRGADEDNPRGYFESSAVKNLFHSAEWLYQGRGRAVKIVAPLLPALPRDLPCRVILVERDLDEVLDSQERMLARRNQPGAATAERRRLLREEYARTLARVKDAMGRRRDTRLLVVRYADAIWRASDTAGKINEFLGGGLDVGKMAAAVEAGLYRNRTS